MKKEILRGRFVVVQLFQLYVVQTYRWNVLVNFAFFVVDTKRLHRRADLLILFLQWHQGVGPRPRLGLRLRVCTGPRLGP